VRGKDDRAEATPCMNIDDSMWFLKACLCFSRFSFFGDFRSLCLEFLWGSFGGVSLRDSCWMSHMRILCLFAW
jgi:hypothetical protein